MLGYSYIQELFQSILNNSKAIEGRFHIAYRYGAQEINSDIMGELLNSVTMNLKAHKKYPMAVLVPPHSRGAFNGDPNGEWERYRIILFFMKTTFYDSTNHTSNPNAKTNTSMHTVTHDWQDMKRASVGFMNQLQNLQRKGTPSLFRVPANQSLTVPMSIVGTDNISGIRLDFDFDLFQGCELPDYNDFMDMPEINTNSHPEHSL